MAFAPVADGIGERRSEPLRNVIVIPVAGGRPGAVGPFPDQFRQGVEEFGAVFTAVGFGQVIGIGELDIAPFGGKPQHGFMGEVRFVGKDRGDRFAELITDRLEISLVGQFDEPADRTRVEGIDVSLVIEPGIA